MASPTPCCATAPRANEESSRSAWWTKWRDRKQRNATQASLGTATPSLSRAPCEMGTRWFSIWQCRFIDMWSSGLSMAGGHGIAECRPHVDQLRRSRTAR
eukprot:858909-Heterocapsa_arctica.AAC.1